VACDALPASRRCLLLRLPLRLLLLLLPPVLPVLLVLPLYAAVRR
jgi:hypothetical protein